MTESSCSFYQHMRQAFGSPNNISGGGGNMAMASSSMVGGGRSNIGDIQSKLVALTHQRGQQQQTIMSTAAAGGNTNSNNNIINNSGGGGGGGRMMMNGSSPQQQGMQQQHGMVDAMGNPVMMVGGAGGGGVGSQQHQNQMMMGGIAPPPSASTLTDEYLSPEEIECLRVVEFSSKVKVLASTPSSNSNDWSHQGGTGGRPAMAHLADNAIVKVFPKHVTLSTASGSPVVEMVIAELYELSEDVIQQSLAFFLRKPSGTSVVEIFCPSAAARTAIYKVVCAKRNMLEQQPY